MNLIKEKIIFQHSQMASIALLLNRS